jgi:hypothetical protein
MGGTLLVETWASDDCVQPGNIVHLRVTITNKGAKTQVIELDDKAVLDIVIGNPDTGRRWSDGKPLTSDLTRLELGPGASKSIEMDWVVDKDIVGPVGINAQFIYSERLGGVTPSVLVNVERCPGSFML